MQFSKNMSEEIHCVLYKLFAWVCLGVHMKQLPYLLNLQNEVGSIKIGKQADFTILARDPLTEPALTVKDIPVVATVQEGGVFLVF